jgi:hypothetical protein
MPLVLRIDLDQHCRILGASLGRMDFFPWLLVTEQDESEEALTLPSEADRWPAPAVD